MAARGVSLPAVALAGAGAVTVWAAMKGVGLASGFRALLAGHTLPAGEDLTVGEAIGGAVGGAAGQVAGIAAAANNAIAGAGLRYAGAGHVYRWGGGNPDRGWDCSGFTNYVLCHDLGLAIPGYGGGAFTGSSHGPVTAQWAIWSGCQSIPREQLDAGDLVVWPARHMGIALDGQTMVHAPGPNGTPAPIIGRIDGSARGPMLCRRLLGRR